MLKAQERDADSPTVTLEGIREAIAVVHTLLQALLPGRACVPELCPYLRKGGWAGGRQITFACTFVTAGRALPVSYCSGPDLECERRSECNDHHCHFHDDVALRQHRRCHLLPVPQKTRPRMSFCSILPRGSGRDLLHTAMCGGQQEEQGNSCWWLMRDISYFWWLLRTVEGCSGLWRAVEGPLTVDVACDSEFCATKRPQCCLDFDCSG